MIKALIVVDYQNDFVEGSLGFASAKYLEPLIKQKIEKALKEGDDVIFTMDTHDKNYLKTREGKMLPIMHCVEGESEWDLYGEIKKFLPHATKVFKKGSFGSIELAEFLRSKKYNKVELVGLVSNICVLTNAVLAQTFSPESEIIIDSACTASSNELLHGKALDIMKGLQMTVL